MNTTNTIFAPGKLVKGKTTGIIIMCTCELGKGPNNSKYNFSGVVISKGNSVSNYLAVGDFCDNWLMDYFEPCDEPVTITPPKKLELTLEDIASKFGVGVDMIKIVKN